MCDNRLKIIVAGDSGVGKTALVHLLCYGEALLNPSWTIGCSLELSIFPKASSIQSQRGSDEERYFVEYWDIGGSASHENTRQVFYDNIHGIILVHDLTNKKSETNLFKWSTEITSKGRIGRSCWRSRGGPWSTKTRSVNSKSPNDSRTWFNWDYVKSRFEVICQPTPIERVGGVFKSPSQTLISSPPASPISSLPTQQTSVSSVITPPVLVVGTKLDQVRGRGRTRAPSPSSLPFSNENSYRPGTTAGSGNFAASHGFPEITLNCNSSASFGENTYNDNVLSAFLQQVIRFKRNNEGVDMRRDVADDYSSSVAQFASLSSHNGGLMTNQLNPVYGRSLGGAVSYRLPNY